MPRRIDIDREVLHDLYYNRQMTQREIWEHLGVTRKVVENNMKRYGMKGRRTGPRSGERHPGWKGGKTTDKAGYILVYKPDHPRANSNGYIREHRLVMESVLGRLLEPHEVVHHIDNNPSNNHPDNLELFSTNAGHLRETLKGQRPKWTEDGRRRILDGVRRGNRPRGPRKPLPVPPGEFEQMCHTMMTKDIARSLGLSARTVEKWMKRLGVVKTRVRVSRREPPASTPIGQTHQQPDAA